MKFNVYGRKLEIVFDDGRWKVFYPGSEGKKRPADDIVIPGTVRQRELIPYLSDIFHEWASPSHSRVFEIKD